MLQVRRDLDFSEEPVNAEHRAELGLEHLERDLAVVLDVARKVDGRHAAGADFALYGIAFGDCSLQQPHRVHDVSLLGDSAHNPPREISYALPPGRASSSTMTAVIHRADIPPSVNRPCVA